MLSANLEKPAKKHYNRLMSRVNAVWIFEISEPVTSILNSTIKEVLENEMFYSYYPTELAIKYGLSHNLIRVEKSKTNPKYHSVYFTEKGMVDNTKKQKTTCAFTGRRVRGEF